MTPKQKLIEMLLKNIADAQVCNKEFYGDHLDAMMEIIMEMKMKITDQEEPIPKGGIDRKDRTEVFESRRLTEKLQTEK